MTSDTARINPYIFGPPVIDPNFFFGREHELETILNTIGHSSPGLRQSMAIVGPRRIGKSSLLHQVVQRLQQLPNVTALVSTESFEEPLPLLLSQEILLELRQNAKEKGLQIAETSFDLLDKSKPLDEQIYQVFRRDLRRLNEGLCSTNQPPAVLMIDEVEGLVEFGGQRVLGFFRDLAQSLPYVLFIVAGSDRLYQLINDNTSPFFNVFKTISITSLEEEDVRAMIREPACRAGIGFEDRAVDEVVKISGGMPYLVNMLCHYATEYILNNKLLEVKTDQVELAQRQIVNQEGYLHSVWQQFQDLEKVILYVLALAKKMLSLEEIIIEVFSITKLNKFIYQIPEILVYLVQSQFLIRDKLGKYSYSNQLLPTWILKNNVVCEEIEKIASHKIVIDSEESIDAKRKQLDSLLQNYRNDINCVEKLNFSEEINEYLQEILSELKSQVSEIKAIIKSLDDPENSSSKDKEYSSTNDTLTIDNKTIPYFEKNFTRVLKTTLPVTARVFMQSVKNVPTSKMPNKASLEFGIKFSATAGILMTQTRGDSAIIFKLSWNLRNRTKGDTE